SSWLSASLNGSALSCASAGPARESAAAIVLPRKARRRTGIPVPPRLLSGFGGDKLPVGIARGHVARKRPHVGHVGDLVRVPHDLVAGLVASHRDQLRDEADGDLRRAPAQFGAGDVGLVDRDEAGLHRLALALALADRGLEPLVDVAREQVPERAPVTL